ncbi:MAG: outer membrane protein transport protein [Balneolaceae bacterium]|nr:outer membrane protein transport protein [Balneolaceae bacterium]
MRKFLKITILFVLIFGVEKAISQHPNNNLLYSNQATLFGDQGVSFDPVSIVLPGTATKSGIGSFMDNPAGIALYEKSYFDFGLSYGSVQEDATYLGNSRTQDNNQFNMSNIGFLYKFPTEQGSFVIGAAYTRHTSFNRGVGFRARNESSTITDQFKTDGSPYQDIAFNTYATDYGDEFQDWDESVFRIGFEQFGDYLGVRQQGEILQDGGGGEYSLFFATEFQKNLMVGASIGLLSGKFEYDRIFQEIDEFNDYNSQIIDSDDDGTFDTDIDNLLLDDNLSTRYNGFRARAGLLYKLTENLNVGVSYTLPTKITIDETFDATLTTTFDNGTEFSDGTDSEFSYNVNYPGMLKIGAALQNLSGLSVSLSAEYVDYSNTEIEFEESELFEDEVLENDFIREAYQSVWSYRAGFAYDVNPGLTLRGGYGFKPSRFDDGIDDKTAYSFGAGFTVGEGLRFEAAARYLTWDEESTVYEYGEYNYEPLPDNLPAVNFRSETANRAVNQWQILGTIRVRM